MPNPGRYPTSGRVKASRISSDGSSSRPRSNVPRRPGLAARALSPTPLAIRLRRKRRRRGNGHRVPPTSFPHQVIVKLAEETGLPDSVRKTLVTLPDNDGCRSSRPFRPLHSPSRRRVQFLRSSRTRSLLPHQKSTNPRWNQRKSSRLLLHRGNPLLRSPSLRNLPILNLSRLQ